MKTRKTKTITKAEYKALRCKSEMIHCVVRDLCESIDWRLESDKKEDRAALKALISLKEDILYNLATFHANHKGFY